MTTTQESGRHVTPERNRADGALVARAGFRLMYECPLAELEEPEEPEDDCPRLRWSWWESESWHGFSDSIPGEDGRMA